MLILGKNTFKEAINEMSNVTVYIIDGNHGIDWSVDCVFEEGMFKKEMISPEIIINDIHSEKNTVEELVGETFSVKKLEESEEREDTFYIYEHEPIKKYQIEILGMEDNKVHLLCKGTAIEDSSTKVAKTVKFEWDAYLPLVIEHKEYEEIPNNESERKVPANLTLAKCVAFGGAEEADLEKYEKETGFCFPDDYRQFLLETNGGMIEPNENYLYYPALREKMKIVAIYSITKILGKGEVCRFNLFRRMKEAFYIPKESFIEVGCIYGPCGMLLLGSKGKKEGVYIWDPLKYHKESKKQKDQLYKVCDTFSQLLEMIIAELP